MGILEQLELEYELDEVEKFLHFFRILCDEFEPLIIELSSKDKYKSALEKIEQLAHNTAWAARRLSLAEVTDFCVFCEEMMNEAKKFEGPASDEFIDWMLLVGEQFENYCKSYEENASNLALFNPLIVNVPNVISL